MAKKRKLILKNLELLKLVMLSVIRLFPYEFQPDGELQGIVLKIYCEKCWRILECIEIILFEKN